MKTSDLGALGLREINSAEQRDISGGFCGDLLSWVIGRAQAGQVWFTVMANMNSIAVASLADFSAVVFCHGVEPEEPMVVKATEEGIPLFSTDLSEFDAAAAFARAFGA